MDNVIPFKGKAGSAPPQTPGGGDGPGENWRRKAFELYQAWKWDELINLCRCWAEVEPNNPIPLIMVYKIFTVENLQEKAAWAFSEYQRINAQVDEMEQFYNNYLYWSIMGDWEAMDAVSEEWLDFWRHDPERADKLNELSGALLRQHMKIHEYLKIKALAEKEGCGIERAYFLYYGGENT